MAGVPLRVMTYNVHNLMDDRAALTSLIRDVEPDVLLIQESPRRFRWRHKCAALADDVGMVIGVGGMPSLGNLILVSLRLKVRHSWCVRFPLTPGRHMRGAAFATCSVRGAQFTVSGSHLSTDPLERPSQAELWKRQLSEIDGIVIAGGDLNEGPGGGAWRTIADGFVTDGAGILTFPARLPQHQLDAVFADPRVTIEKYTIIDTDRARLASDHLPVIADLRLPST
jgi:endonuclease/exonuclease/phosphatase family metal-dependent hydrolase